MRAQASVSRSLLVALMSILFALFGVACGATATAEKDAAMPRAAYPAPAPEGAASGADYAMADSADVVPAEIRNEAAGQSDTKLSSQRRAKAFAAMQASSRGVANAASGQAAKDAVEPDDNATKSQKAPLLIYKADVALAVFEVKNGLDAVEKIARDAQGYLVSRRDDSIIVRVPAAGFDGSLQSILKLGDVLKRDLQVEDVTAQMNDLTTRLKNAEAMRARLEQLLNTAKTTEEALKVEEQLGRVTGEIESLKGKIRLMSELVAFSTITVTFRPTITEKVNSKFKLPFPWLEELGLSRLLSL